MFVEEYEKMSRGDRMTFSETLNDLLYQSFIVRKSYDKKAKMFKADPNYLFIDRYFSVFEEYLSYMGMDLSKNDDDGVIFVTSQYEKNHFRFDPTTTLVVFALRSYYEGQIENRPDETEVLMTSGSLNSLVQELGLSNASKRLSVQTMGQVLRTLDSFNVVNRADGSYSDPSFSFFILPTIRYIMTAEKINALYAFLNNKEEEEEPLHDDLGISSFGGNN